MMSLAHKVLVLGAIALAGCKPQVNAAGVMSLPTADIHATSAGIMDSYKQAGGDQFMKQQINNLKAVSWTDFSARMDKLADSSFEIDGAVLKSDVLSAAEKADMKDKLAKLDAQFGNIAASFKDLGIDANTQINAADLKIAVGQIHLLNNDLGRHTPQAQKAFAMLFLASQAMPGKASLGLNDSVHDQVKATWAIVKCTLTLFARCNGHGWMDQLNQAGDKPMTCGSSANGVRPNICDSMSGINTSTIGGVPIITSVGTSILKK